MEKLTEYEVIIDQLAYGGDGLARLPEGRVVFIPTVIPGEKVSIRIVDDKQKYARAEVVEVLIPSELRAEAPCPHFGVCGGCQYQHIRYNAQVQFKQQILKEQLSRIGHLDAVGEVEGFPSDLPFGYRNVMQFHPLPNGKLGLMKRDSNDGFELTRCLLPQPAVQDFWPNFTLEQNSGIQRVEMRQNSDGELMITLEGEEGEIPEIEMEAPVNLVHRTGNESVVLSGEDALTMWVQDIPFHLSSGSFFQVNDGVTEKLVAYLKAIVEKKSPQTVLDLYAGVGLFSRFLAPLAHALIAVESNPDACRDFVINLDAFENVSLYEGMAEEVLPALELKAQLAVCDPPRAGLHADVIDALVESGVTTLIYVSCDPATLARDIQRLGEKGFGIEKIALFDIFPQTYHMECCVLFENKNTAE
ncbi:MAG: class I SAM-dependent RNA methyltransferase [Anaerolineaceae bacterium]